MVQFCFFSAFANTGTTVQLTLQGLSGTFIASEMNCKSRDGRGPLVGPCTGLLGLGVTVEQCIREMGSHHACLGMSSKSSVNPSVDKQQSPAEATINVFLLYELYPLGAKVFPCRPKRAL